MEPTAEELNQIGDLKGAYDWAGVPDDVRDSLGQALGDPTKIRDINHLRHTYDLGHHSRKDQRFDTPGCRR